MTTHDNSRLLVEELLVINRKCTTYSSRVSDFGSIWLIKSCVWVRNAPALCSQKVVVLKLNEFEHDSRETAVFGV
jgi:hypothetical protein